MATLECEKTPETHKIWVNAKTSIAQELAMKETEKQKMKTLDKMIPQECYELFFSFDTCLPSLSLLFFIYDRQSFTTRQTCLSHMFILFLPYVLHVFASRPTPSSYLFKPVARQLYSLAFH